MSDKPWCIVYQVVDDLDGDSEGGYAYFPTRAAAERHARDSSECADTEDGPRRVVRIKVGAQRRRNLACALLNGRGYAVAQDELAPARRVRRTTCPSCGAPAPAGAPVGCPNGCGPGNGAMPFDEKR